MAMLNIDRNNRKIMVFEDLKIKEVFCIDVRVYMKTEEAVAGNGLYRNAVCFDDGSIVYIMNRQVVFPLVATMTVSDE